MSSSERPEVSLRPFEPADAAAVHRWFNNPDVTADLVGSRDGFSEEAAGGWVERAMDTSRDRKWAILLDGGSEPVGFVALFGLERETGRPKRGLIEDPCGGCADEDRSFCG